MNPTTMNDRELDMAIGAAYVDEDLPRLHALEAEHDRRRRDEERERLANAERARRTHASAEAERRALLERLTKQCDAYRARFIALLRDIDTASDKAALVPEAYQVGRQAYSLGHDLASVTGNHRSGLRYDVPDQLVLHGGRAAEGFLAEICGRPVSVPTPWQRDIERLRELMPHVEDVRNGG